jgi:Rieske Fe-S protein
MNAELSQPRRQFLRIFTLGTVVSTLAGKTLVQRVLANLQDEDTSGVLTIKLSDFPVLNNLNGSIRINLHPIAGNGQPGRWYPVILTRGTGTTFHPLEGRCTHEACILTWFGFNNINAISCPCHDSRFTRAGVRISGQAPLGVNLTAYPYTFDGSAVHIRIPGFYHKASIAQVQTLSGQRLRLDFPASRNARHEILHRPTVNDPWTPISFAITPDGPANRMFYSFYENYGSTTPETQNASAYVDFPGDSGLFAVSLQTTVEP